MICVKTRLGEIHVVNWTTSRGLHYTLCGKSFSNKGCVETFAANNVFPGMCPNCHDWQEAGDMATANDDARLIKPTQLLSISTGVYQGVQKGWESTKELFEDTLDRRYWPKKTRMRRKFPGEETVNIRKYKLHGKSKRK